MIDCLRLLRNVGVFDSATAATIRLRRYTLIFAENGRGKTTLSAILRSLATGDPFPIAERRRLGTANPPHAVLECSGGPPDAIFQHTNWNRTLSGISIFDDRFVDENVHSGLAVDPEHRQNLHELILGAQGVALNKELQDAVEQITRDNTNIQNTGQAIPAAERHGLSLDEFCSLQAVAGLDQAVGSAEQSLRSARQATAIQRTNLFTEVELPPIDSSAINAILSRDLAALDAGAIERVHQHCRALGEHGEEWISTGMQILSGAEKNADCPFCEQPLSGSPRIDDYRAYFSEEYANLRQSVLEAISSVERENSGVSLAAFERAVTAARDTNIFWGEFTPLEPIAINAAQITEHRIAARDALLHALGAKRMAPLEQRTLSAAELGSIESFNAHAAEIVQLNRRFVAANLAIQEVKRTAATANIQVIENELNRLRAARARYLPPTAGLCEAYLLAKAAKTLTEQRRERAKEALRQYRTAVFPQYQKSVNDYLALFNTGFRIGQVTPRDTVGGPTCTYNVVIDNATVPVTGGTSQVGEPSFRSTLSSGDRNTLALAFFFASIDHDQQLANKIVVIDDPASSLDDHRSLATVQHARRLGERVDQLIVLSHNKAFLCDLYSGIDQTLCTAISIVRGQSGSALAVWDINSDRVSEHDIRHELLLQYLRNGPVNLNNREVASSIRPHLEAFLRVSCPDTFRPGSQLGPFRGLCEQRVGQPNQILSRHYIDELRDLTEYGNRYHHLGTNKAWATEAINDAQLRGYIDRLMAFMSR